MKNMVHQLYTENAHDYIYHLSDASLRQVIAYFGHQVGLNIWEDGYIPFSKVGLCLRFRIFRICAPLSCGSVHVKYLKRCALMITPKAI